MVTDLAISPSAELWVGTNMGVQKYDYQTDTFSLIKFTKGIGCTYLEFDHPRESVDAVIHGFSIIKYNEQPSYTKTTCIRIVIRSPLSISPPKIRSGPPR